ncbi:MAG: hypothetical protein J1F32_01595 [Erysipelotrichales bacterium]|nr:hypothetical protein [Erysipelotrichales bacterium]
MKAILISIQPKWVEKILNGEKTIEIRKTIPKCDFPIDVYVYCTKSSIHDALVVNSYGAKYMYAINRETAIPIGGYMGNGNVVAKFTLNKVEQICVFDNGSIQNWNYNDLEKSCLSYDEVSNYIGKGKTGYAWYIDNLQTFNFPMELSDFHKIGFSEELTDLESSQEDYIGMECYANHENVFDKLFKDLHQEYCIKRPPQSYQYVEVE